MKRKRMGLLITFAIVSAAILLCAVSCAENRGTDRLSAFLYSPEYTAEFDFVLDGADDDESLSGSAVAVKKENVCLTFSSPGVFEGLSVESGENGESDTLMFGYYGMKAPLPKGALTKINLVLSFFSDETASALSSLPRGAVADCEMSDGDFADTVIPRSCIFETNDGNTVCTLVFDAASGLPMEYKAEADGMCARMTFTDIKHPG